MIDRQAAILREVIAPGNISIRFGLLPAAPAAVGQRDPDRLSSALNERS